MNKEMRVTNWRALAKDGSLRGFFSLELPSGMTLHSCTFNLRKDGAKWVGLPSRSYEQNGETKWQRLVDFVDKDKYAKFQDAAKAALEAYFKEHPEQSAVPTQQGDRHGVAATDQEVPF